MGDAMEYDPDETTLLQLWAGHLGCLRRSDIFCFTGFIVDVDGVRSESGGDGEKRFVSDFFNGKSAIERRD